MNWRQHCGVVIPCLDEGRGIGPLVAAVRRHLPTVVVVDDGSTDDTGAAATACGAMVLRHERPRGKGAALRLGISWLAEKGMDWAIAMDGDGQHAPGDIPRFLEAASSSRAVLLVGNRMGNPVGMPWIRRVVNRWMSRRLSRRAGQSLPDSQCGYRMLRLDAWRKLDLRTSHFEIESETLLAFAVAGFPIRFLEVETVYGGEQSKISPMRDSWRWIRWFCGSDGHLPAAGPSDSAAETPALRGPAFTDFTA